MGKIEKDNEWPLTHELSTRGQAQVPLLLLLLLLLHTVCHDAKKYHEKIEILNYDTSIHGEC